MNSRCPQQENILYQLFLLSCFILLHSCYMESLKEKKKEKKKHRHISPCFKCCSAFKGEPKLRQHSSCEITFQSLPSSMRLSRYITFLKYNSITPRIECSTPGFILPETHNRMRLLFLVVGTKLCYFVSY